MSGRARLKKEKRRSVVHRLYEIRVKKNQLLRQLYYSYFVHDYYFIILLHVWVNTL